MQETNTFKINDLDDSKIEEILNMDMNDSY